MSIIVDNMMIIYMIIDNIIIIDMMVVNMMINNRIIINMMITFGRVLHREVGSTKTRLPPTFHNCQPSTMQR